MAVEELQGVVRWKGDICGCLANRSMEIYRKSRGGGDFLADDELGGGEPPGHLVCREIRGIDECDAVRQMVCRLRIHHE